MPTKVAATSKRLLKYQFRDLEKIPVKVWDDSLEASAYVAQSIALAMRKKQQEGELLVLGLVAGSSPIQVYHELVRMHQEEGLSFRNVVTFNVNEYYPIKPTAEQSHRHFMHDFLFDKVDIRPENIHLPDSTLELEEVDGYCTRYDKLIASYGGIDIQLLGIGRTGHLGFNEPGSWAESATGLVRLDALTRQDAVKDFMLEENVPYRAISMGLKPILQAKAIYLMAWGQHKAPILARAVEGEVSDQVPASFLQRHQQVKVIVDRAAAEDLTRFKAPWKVGLCNWDTDLRYRAVLWLSQHTKTPILKLTDEHYSAHGLQDLILEQARSYDLNMEVFNRLQSTITNWPGGKPDAEATIKPDRAILDQKRIIIFSPHPGDGVTNMGATFQRLLDQGHEVHLAYQTSGSATVHDHDAYRFAEFMKELSEQAKNFTDPATKAVVKNAEKIIKFLRKKAPGQVDIPEVRLVKGLIRRGEARAGARAVGLTDESRIHFLDLPFYEGSSSRKIPLGKADVEAVKNLIEIIKPHQVFAAGDLADPHGTHRICLTSILSARKSLKDKKWMKESHLWLYRGVWGEWPVHNIEMAVPFGPDQLKIKRQAIFMHQSQKNRMLFPSQDSQDFLLKAEEQTQDTASMYRSLGLAEYEAMEAFLRWKE